MLWLIIASSGWISSPLPERVAHVDQEYREAVASVFFTWSSGVVRASSSIRSECSAREVQIFWPLTT